MVIAYMRKALMQSDGQYDRNSLMYHIIETNVEKKKEIQALKMTINEENIDKVKAEILEIQKKMDYRQGVLSLLRNLEERHLKEITRPE